jgi:tRNA (Thr-GGU) A37 N-methylase
VPVHPIGREEFPLKGIYATCSPARPNPVLVNAVLLLERNANVLRISGLEAVDGTPLVDIKPYVPVYFKVEDPWLPDWMDRIVRELAEG